MTEQNMEIIQQTEHQLLRLHNQTLRQAVHELEMKLEHSQMSRVIPQCNSNANDDTLLREQLVQGQKEVAELKELIETLTDQNTYLRTRLEEESGGKLLETQRVAFRFREQVLAEEIHWLREKYECLRERYMNESHPDEFLKALEEKYGVTTYRKVDDMAIEQAEEIIEDREPASGNINNDLKKESDEELESSDNKEDYEEFSGSSNLKSEQQADTVLEVVSPDAMPQHEDSIQDEQPVHNDNQSSPASSSHHVTVSPPENSEPVEDGSQNSISGKPIDQDDSIFIETKQEDEELF